MGSYTPPLQRDTMRRYGAVDVAAGGTIAFPGVLDVTPFDTLFLLAYNTDGLATGAGDVQIFHNIVDSTGNYASGTGVPGAASNNGISAGKANRTIRLDVRGITALKLHANNPGVVASLNIALDYSGE